MLTALLGWSGTACYLLAHAWLALLKKAPQRGYFIANLVAALLVTLSSILLSSWQPVVINGFWAVVSLAAFSHFNLPKLGVNNRLLLLLVIVLFSVGLILLLGQNARGTEVWAWSSVLAFCLSYWRFSAGLLTQLGYYLFSAYAAFILLPQLYLDQNWPVFLLESVWGVLSLIGWWRLSIFAQKNT